jgi:DNA-binding beta-propeller fold protein YncE
VPFNQHSIKFNPSDYPIYISNDFPANSVTTIDSNTGEIKIIPVGTRLSTLTYNEFNKKMYVVDQSSHQV